MRPLLFIFSLLFVLTTARAEVVRLAPDFSFQGIGPKAQTLRGLRGQPVVLIVAQSPKDWNFRAQVKDLKRRYQEYANKQVVFVAAFTKEAGPVKSDIPIVVANDVAGVSSAYGMQDKINIAIIGKDGNVDYQTKKVLGAERINDVIQNSYAVQSVTGRK